MSEIESEGFDARFDRHLAALSDVEDAFHIQTAMHSPLPSPSVHSGGDSGATSAAAADLQSSPVMIMQSNMCMAILTATTSHMMTRVGFCILFCLLFLFLALGGQALKSETEI